MYVIICMFLQYVFKFVSMHLERLTLSVVHAQYDTTMHPYTYRHVNQMDYECATPAAAWSISPLYLSIHIYIQTHKYTHMCKYYRLKAIKYSSFAAHARHNKNFSFSKLQVRFHLAQYKRLPATAPTTAAFTRVTTIKKRREK